MFTRPTCITSVCWALTSRPVGQKRFVPKKKKAVNTFKCIKSAVLSVFYVFSIKWGSLCVFSTLVSFLPLTNCLPTPPTFHLPAPPRRYRGDGPFLPSVWHMSNALIVSSVGKKIIKQLKKKHHVCAHAWIFSFWLCFFVLHDNPWVFVLKWCWFLFIFFKYGNAASWLASRNNWKVTDCLLVLVCLFFLLLMKFVCLILFQTKRKM